MCLLLETIRIEEGSPRNLEYHRQRMARSRAALFKDSGLPGLSLVPPPGVPSSGISRWRLVYGRTIVENTVEPYRPKKIASVKLVEGSTVSYAFKYADRTVLNELLEQRAGFDDILITRNGLLTDMSYANVALFDGNAWYTPRNPLLAGTCRARLLDLGLLHEADIRVDDLKRYITVSVINAMLELGEMTFPVSGITP